ncbi:MAG: site-specific integrase [Candidatus Acidiferrum sp.]
MRGIADDAIATYLSTVAATRAHKTWLAYNLSLNTFRDSCAKEHLDEIDKNDLTVFVVALKKDEQDDRTVANRVANVVTFYGRTASSLLRCGTNTPRRK